MSKRAALNAAYTAVGLDDVAAALTWLKERGVTADRTEAYVVRRKLLAETRSSTAAPPARSETPPPARSRPRKTTPPQEPDSPAAPAAEAARERRARAPIPVPGENESFSARIPLTTTPAQERALKVARLEDRVPVNARIRAMIALYMQDEAYRRRVDRIAPRWRG